jgi:hypothetical protein
VTLWFGVRPQCDVSHRPYTLPRSPHIASCTPFEPGAVPLAAHQSLGVQRAPDCMLSSFDAPDLTAQDAASAAGECTLGLDDDS